MTRKILLGDVFEKIKEIPDETVDVVCTSPPYWGLRDYGTGKWEGGDLNCDHKSAKERSRYDYSMANSKIQDGSRTGTDAPKWKSVCPDCGAKRIDLQLGMEPDFHDYLAKLNTLMRELRRVLKKTGTCWVNLGDTYSTVSGGMKDIANFGQPVPKGLKPKCRVGIPERFYINCIDDGWIARNHIVWTKNNAMPSSVKDRFTNKWESLFFFAKEKKYYFNLDIVREECITKPKPFNVRVRDSNNARFLQKATDEEKANHNKKGEKKSDDIFEYRPGTDLKQNYDGSKYDNQKEEGLHRQGLYKGKYADFKDVNHPLGKNPGDIFLINTKAYKGAHFAVFPPALPEKILKCSCPNQVCNKCGKPRYPIVERTSIDTSGEKELAIEGSQYKLGKTSALRMKGGGPKYNAWKEQNPDKFIGYTDCGCNDGFKPGLVLDPFLGSGTTAWVAQQLNLNWIGIELNEEYAKISKDRLGLNNSLGEYL